MANSELKMILDALDEIGDTFNKYDRDLVSALEPLIDIIDNQRDLPPVVQEALKYHDTKYLEGILEAVDSAKDLVDNAEDIFSE